MSQAFEELTELERIVDSLPDGAVAEILTRVPSGSSSLPVYAVDFGPRLPPESPVVVYVGGVHGLESIGTQILLAHLASLRAALSWDTHLTALLEQVRVIFVPLANPAGVLERRRSNGRGVDLMRNAPVDSDERSSPLLLFRGHRLSPRLPWYRGRKGSPMEAEAQALVDLVQRVCIPSRFAITFDVHSGFLGKDRLWFPYAHTRRPFPRSAEMLALKDVLDGTYPNHRYVIEPQASQYTTHGDLWDHAYDLHAGAKGKGIYLPLTLELGSSSWLRKNPGQVLDRRGIFHPLEAHRVVRVLRRHAHLLEVMMRLGLAADRWLPRDAGHRRQLTARALATWPA